MIAIEQLGSKLINHSNKIKINTFFIHFYLWNLMCDYETLKISI